MTILATNKATKRSNFENITDYIDAGFCIIATLLVLVGSWVAYTMSTSFLFGMISGLLLFVLGLIFIYMALMCIDNHRRWNRCEETVWVDDGVLVIDCEGSILRRHKKIPLSKIRKVKQYSDIEILQRVYAPDRLKVIYSGIRRYRFGMCMNSYERDTLAKIIMALVEESKRKEEVSKRDEYK